MPSGNHFHHHFAASFLQGAHPAIGQKPHPFISIPAVENIETVAGDCVMESASVIFGQKFEKRLAPRVVSIMEDFCAQLLNFFNLDGSNRFGDGFASLLVQIFKVELL